MIAFRGHLESKISAQQLERPTRRSASETSIHRGKQNFSSPTGHCKTKAGRDFCLGSTLFIMSHPLWWSSIRLSSIMALTFIRRIENLRPRYCAKPRLHVNSGIHSTSNTRNRSSQTSEYCTERQLILAQAHKHLYKALRNETHGERSVFKNFLIPYHCSVYALLGQPS